MLFHVPSTEMGDDGVTIALVSHDWQRHRVNRSVRWTNEHCTVVVLSGHVADVSVFLDHVFDSMSFAHYVVKDKVCALAQTENTHAV